MQRTLLLAALAPTLLGLTACDDLGKCDDPKEGRNAVWTAQGRVMYAGQAILIASCATGCHASDAKGDNRKGAPAGLDFDIVPVISSTTEMRPDGTKVAVADDPDALSGLRKRQRKVFDNRHGIWEQIVDKLMPPDGVGEGFKKISAGSFYTQAGDGTCTRTTKLGPFSDKATQKVLRQWLACGAPIVEMNSDQLTDPVGGTIGDQYRVCEGGAADLEPTFDNLQEQVFASSCVNGCHVEGGLWPDFDLSTKEIAYEALLGADGQGAPQECADNADPMVTPGDPDASYLMAKLGATSEPFCGTKMPIGTPLTPELIDLVRRWIEAGAPAPGEPAGGTGGMSMPDAGM